MATAHHRRALRHAPPRTCTERRAESGRASPARRQPDAARAGMREGREARFLSLSLPGVQIWKTFGRMGGKLLPCPRDTGANQREAASLPAGRRATKAGKLDSFPGRLDRQQLLRIRGKQPRGSEQGRQGSGPPKPSQNSESEGSCFVVRSREGREAGLPARCLGWPA